MLLIGLRKQSMEFVIALLLMNWNNSSEVTLQYYCALQYPDINAESVINSSRDVYLNWLTWKFYFVIAQIVKNIVRMAQPKQELG